MKKERRTWSAHCVLMGFCVLAVLSVTGVPALATSGDYDDLVPGPVLVGLMAEEQLNLLPPGRLKAGSSGARIDGNLFVFGPFGGELGGTVNVEYAVVTGLIGVGPGATMTVRGKKFEVSGKGELDNPTNPTVVSFLGGAGSLLVTYENGTTTELRFMYSSQPIYLADNEPEAIEADVDIKPGSDENVINPKSNGLVPVAIYTTDALDATQIDPASIDLGGAKVATRGKGDKLMAHLEDVNGDGKMDLMLQIELPSGGGVRATSKGPAWVTGEIELSGKTLGAKDIRGSDSVVIIPAGK